MPPVHPGADRTVLVTLPWITDVRNVRPTINFGLFPNPASDRVTIVSPTKASASIRPINAGGQLVRKAARIDQPFNVDVSDLAAGICSVTVRLDDGVGRRKLIID